MRIVLRSFVAVLLLGAAAAALAQDIRLAPEEIKSAWVGKKLFSRSAMNGALGEFSMRADGTAVLSTGNFADSGTWRLSKDGYCATWQKIRKGKEGCFTVVRRGASTLVLNEDGSTNSEILRVVD